jgi:hypothetical protein
MYIEACMTAQEEVIIGRMAYVLINYCTCTNYVSVRILQILHNKKYMKFRVVADFNKEFYLEEHFHSSYNLNLEQERNECVVAFGQL